MMTPKISIIIPVYNVEKYLARCLDSIASQTWTDYECVLVDDGSMDRSGEICDAYTNRDARFTVIHKENEGLSVARNTAMRIVRGEFLCFVDSDDYIFPDYLKRMLTIQQQENVDMVMCSYASNTGINRSNEPTIVIETGREFTKKVLRDEVGSQLWQYLYKRSLWEGIFSPPDRQAQDMMILYRITIKANRIAVTDEVLYFYFASRNDSTSNAVKKKAKGAFDRSFAFCGRYDFSMEQQDLSSALISLKNMITFYNNAIYIKNPDDRSFDKDITFLRCFLKHNMSVLCFKNQLGIKKRVQAVLLAYVPNLYCFMRGTKK